MKRNIEKIKEKAEYCLHCKTKPCRSGCPLQNNIPDFIEQIKNDNFEEAYKILSETTIFESICGRICPHSSQCEGNCIRGIKGESVHIGELESFIGDYILENENNINKKIEENSRKIAIIGSGPAGIACAYSLRKEGYKVTIYEKHEKLGGLLRYGIPEFRLSKEILDKWIDKVIYKQGIKVYTNIELGKDVTVQELKGKYDNIILAFGANISNKMNILGEENKNVLGANELLEYQNYPDFKDKIVTVNGGGNVAMDIARTINKLGAKKVIVVYRRSEQEMPAEKKEIEAAKIEGVELLFQTNILQIEKNRIECIKTELVAKEGETRKYPVNIKDSNYWFDIDYLIMAIGAKTDSKVIEHLNLETTKWGYIKVDENYRTSDKKIYAIGDLIGTKQTVAWAARSGFECAKKIKKQQV